MISQQQPCKPPPGKCNSVRDCQGLEHQACQGSWICEKTCPELPGECKWECNYSEYLDFCNSPVDCENKGLTVEFCKKWSWNCEKHHCVPECLIPDNDMDRDNIPDSQDECPMDPGNDQDSDRICGDKDNCPDVYNPLQKDSDRDGIGDACDPDNAVSFQVKEEDSDHIIVEIKMNTVVQMRRIQECKYEGCRKCNRVNVPTLHNSSEPGEPMLPFKTATVLLPFDVNQIHVVDHRVRLANQQLDITATSVCRSVYQNPWPPTPDGPDSGIYPQSHFYVTGAMQHKNIKYLRITFYPVILNYDNNTVEVADYIRLKITYNHTQFQSEIPPGPDSVIMWWKNILNKNTRFWFPGEPSSTTEHKDILVLTVDHTGTPPATGSQVDTDTWIHDIKTFIRDKFFHNRQDADFNLDVRNITDICMEAVISGLTGKPVFTPEEAYDICNEHYVPMTAVRKMIKRAYQEQGINYAIIVGPEDSFASGQPPHTGFLGSNEGRFIAAQITGYIFHDATKPCYYLTGDDVVEFSLAIPGSGRFPTVYTGLIRGISSIGSKPNEWMDKKQTWPACSDWEKLVSDSIYNFKRAAIKVCIPDSVPSGWYPFSIRLLNARGEAAVSLMRAAHDSSNDCMGPVEDIPENQIGIMDTSTGQIITDRYDVRVWYEI